MKNHDKIIKHMALLITDILLALDRITIGVDKKSLEKHVNMLRDYASQIDEKESSLYG